PIGDKNVDEGTSLSFSISAADADGDAITYSGSSLPSGASFNGSTRTFIWTPGAAQSGTYSGVRFSASDGSLTDSETITITVNDTMVAPNRPPVLASIGSKKVNEGASLSFTISATDPDGDALTYSSASLPSGASFNSSTRTFSWKPGYSQAGTYSNIRFSVSDGKATDYENILITVSHINQAPVLAAIGDKAVSEGALLSFAITATDPDGDALTYSAVNLPSGASFNAATRTFSWRPRSSQAGLFAGVHFQVSDGRLTDQEDIAVTVKAVQNDDNRKTSGSGGGGGGGGGNDNPTTLDIQTEGLASTPAVQISPDGMVTGDYELKTNDGTLTLNISDGSKLLTKEKNAVSLLSAEVLSSTPATPSGEALIIAFRLGPDGATVDPSLTISFSYEAAKLPTGVAGGDLLIAFYDGLQWRTVESSVDQQANTVSAQITHFSHYALLGRVTPPLVPVILPAEPALTTPSDSPLNTPTPEIGSQFASLNIDQNLQAASRIAPDKGVVPAPASLPVSGEVIKIEENVQPASLAPYQDISRTPGIMPDTRMEAPILSSPLPEETAAPGEQTQIAYLASVETALVNPLPDPYESATPTEEVSKAEKSQGGLFRWPFLLAIVAVIAAMILVIEVVMGVSLLIIRRRNGINPQ
ncbi:MAG: hypothetical protein H6Q39_1825, partial [Chloroflexi bacterium]|nr:hypothetical protein [Chloroflexota bacterium]